MNSRDHEPLTPEERDLAQRLSRLDAHAAPSAALDERILAAARAGAGVTHAASDAIPRSRRRTRWPVGLGIAASLAVAVGIAWQLRPQPESQALPAPSADAMAERSVAARPAPADAAGPAEAETTAAPPPLAITPAPAPAQTATQQAPAPAASERERLEAASATAALAAREEALSRELAAEQEKARQRRVAAPPVPQARDERLPPPPPAPAAPASATIVAQPVFTPSPTDAANAGAEPARRAHRQAGATATPSLDQIVVTGTRAEPASAEIDTLADLPAPAIDDQPLDDQPPATVDSPEVRDSWLQRIRELRDAGAHAEARASLHEFMRRHPQAGVPDDLRPLLDE